jgi:hypothetical protein
MRSRVRKALAAVTFVALLAGGGVWASARPSHDRPWRPEQAVLPEVTITDGRVHVRNVRDFRYATEDAFAVRYVDRTYDLSKIEGVWFALSPFHPDWRGPAHSFLSFSFADSQFVAVSFEARREVGEAYGLLKGALRAFELMAVVGTEPDVLGLRAVTWEDPLYLYPGRATPAQARALFLAVMRRAQAVSARPEFYHTLTNNCTTNLVDAVNAIAAEPIPYGLDVLLPGYSDELAYERGLIDTDLPLEAARERFLVDPRVAAAAVDAPDFSFRIRD